MAVALAAVLCTNDTGSSSPRRWHLRQPRRLASAHQKKSPGVSADLWMAALRSPCLIEASQSAETAKATSMSGSQEGCQPRVWVAASAGGGGESVESRGGWPAGRSLSLRAEAEKRATAAYGLFPEVFRCFQFGIRTGLICRLASATTAVRLVRVRDWTGLNCAAASTHSAALC